MKDRTHISGIILAGGKSSRMGADKGLLVLEGKTFVEHVIMAMKPLVDDIIIVSDDEAYDQFGYERIDDLIKDAGPVAGLFAGLKHSKTDYNLVLSCDVPLITTEILKELIATNYKSFDVVQVQSGEKTMPLIALYHKSCWQLCLDLLKENERRLRVVVGKFKTKSIILLSEFDTCVKNVNTKDDLKQIKHAIDC